MSIYVYITRRHNPIEDDGPDIEENEWLGVLDADPSFRRPDAAEIGEDRKVKSAYAVWTAHPEGLEAWFIWTSGQVDISGPDEPMIAKAMTLASKLAAQVVSEMGEFYNDDGTHKGFVDGEPW